MPNDLEGRCHAATWDLGKLTSYRFTLVEALKSALSADHPHSGGLGRGHNLDSEDNLPAFAHLKGSGKGTSSTVRSWVAVTVAVLCPRNKGPPQNKPFQTA